MFRFCKICDAVESAPADESSLLVGQWQGLYIRSESDDSTFFSEKRILDYFITINADGTFTAMLDEKRTGTWDIYYPPRGDPYGRLYFDGIPGFSYTDICDGGEIRISAYSNDIYSYLHFLDEESHIAQAAAEKEAVPNLLGNWSSLNLSTQFYDGGGAQVKGFMDYAISFAEDGTFTAVLDREYTGTWLYLYTGFGEFDRFEHYALTFDGIPGTVPLCLIRGDSITELSLGYNITNGYTEFSFYRISEDELEIIRQDIQQLQGTWHVVSATQVRNDLPANVEGRTITFRSDFTFRTSLLSSSTGSWCPAAPYSEHDFVCYIGGSGTGLSLKDGKLVIEFDSTEGRIIATMEKS